MRSDHGHDGDIVDPARFLRARTLVIFSLMFGSLVVILLQPRIPQSNAYHEFADQRSFFGVPGYLNVVSNIGFLFAGIGGIGACLIKPAGRLQNAWLSLFAGVSLIAFGSAYYHFAPGHSTLVWDRLPMTIGFMGLLVAVLGEYVDERVGMLLVPMLIAGTASVVFWYLNDDLRLYLWIQAVPLMVIPALILLFRPRYSHQWLLAVSLGLYVIAKAAEFYDRGIFAATGNSLSGHTVKHVLSAAGCGAIAVMLHKRRPLIP